MRTIALAIPSCTWVPERAASLQRLCAALTTPLGLVDQRVFDEKAPNWHWSEILWRWGAETTATHLLQLQDDVLVAPNFWPALAAMLEAVPDEVIGLEAVHPAGKTIARDGGRWYTTSDGLIGCGYLLPTPLLREFLTWRRDGLRKGAVEAITEDTLLGVWAMATGRRIWHPAPTLIDHDTSIASTYGHEHHAYRRPSVTWRDGDVCGWEAEDLGRAGWWSHVPPGPVRLGRFYRGTHWLCKAWVKDWTPEKHAAAEADVCPEPYSRWL